MKQLTEVRSHNLMILSSDPPEPDGHLDTLTIVRHPWSRVGAVVCQVGLKMESGQCGTWPVVSGPILVLQCTIQHRILWLILYACPQLLLLPPSLYVELVTGLWTWRVQWPEESILSARIGMVNGSIFYFKIRFTDFSKHEGETFIDNGRGSSLGDMKMVERIRLWLIGFRFGQHCWVAVHG